MYKQILIFVGAAGLYARNPLVAYRRSAADPWLSVAGMFPSTGWSRVEEASTRFSYRLAEHMSELPGFTKCKCRVLASDTVRSRGLVFESSHALLVGECGVINSNVPTQSIEAVRLSAPQITAMT